MKRRKNAKATVTPTLLTICVTAASLKLVIMVDQFGNLFRNNREGMNGVMQAATTRQ